LVSLQLISPCLSVGSLCLKQVGRGLYVPTADRVCKQTLSGQKKLYILQIFPDRVKDACFEQGPAVLRARKHGDMYQGDFFIFLFVLYSTLLQLPPIRLHRVGICCDRTQVALEKRKCHLADILSQVVKKWRMVSEGAGGGHRRQDGM
jgi:hypothetical protein